MGISEWDIENGWRDETPAKPERPEIDPRRIPWPQPRQEIVPTTPTPESEIDRWLPFIDITKIPSKRPEPEKPVIH